MVNTYILSTTLVGLTFLSSIFLLLGTSYSALAIASNNNTISLTTLKGYVDGVIVSYIVTDTSDNKTAESITDSQGHKINFAPLLAYLFLTTISRMGYIPANHLSCSERNSRCCRPGKRYG